MTGCSSLISYSNLTATLVGCLSLTESILVTRFFRKSFISSKYSNKPFSVANWVFFFFFLGFFLLPWYFWYCFGQSFPFWMLYVWTFSLCIYQIHWSFCNFGLLVCFSKKSILKLTSWFYCFSVFLYITFCLSLLISYFLIYLNLLLWRIIHWEYIISQ